MRSLMLAVFVALIPQFAFASPLKLNSGKVVEIEAVGPMHFAKAKPALVLRYRTQLSIDDLNALRKEIDEIWQHFVIDADRGKFETALIMANGPQSGLIIKTGKSYNFLFSKIGGFWRAVEPGTDADTKLTKAIIRAFYDRWDWLLTNNNGNALSLYLDESWVIKATGGPDGPEQIDRKAFVAAINAPTDGARLLNHSREILDIQIDAKTNTARVKCRETTERQLSGGSIKLVESTTDDIALKERILSIKASTSVIELLKQSTQGK